MKNKILKEILSDYSLDYFGGMDEVLLALTSGYRSSSLSSYKYSKLSKYLCPDKPKGVSLSNYLLKQSGVYYCGNCKSVKPLSEFRENSSKALGIQSNCILCQGNLTAQTQPHRQSKYRCAKLNATPPWAELDKIKEVYELCPKGMSVDHIVPLQGTKVCGLHVHYNLQYLTPSENSRKRNKFR